MNIVSLLYNKIQIVCQKKRLLGKSQQFEASVIIPPEEATTFNLDQWALYFKRALSLLPEKTVSGKVKLILGHSFWQYFQIELQPDLSNQALANYIKEQLINKTGDLNESSFYKYIVQDYKGKKYAGVYLLTHKIYTDLVTLFSFYDLKIEEIYPEALLVFTLFEHTLNKQKEEAALFLEYEKTISSGLLFNSTGLLSEKVIVLESNDLTKKLKEFKKNQTIPVNRLILGGELSTQIRQDNFTKESGIWTNPLEKVLQNSTLKQMVEKLGISHQLLPFSRELKLIELINNKKHFDYYLDFVKSAKPITRSTPKQNLPLKAIFKILFLVLISSALTYSLFNFSRWGIDKLKKFSISSIKINLPAQATPTPSPKPTPKVTPTPALRRDELELEILNGTGVPGMASSLQTELEDLGYQVIEIGNADNYDYEQTVIIAKKQTVFDLLKKDLKPFNITKPKFEKTNSTTITIIFGSDLELP